MAHWQDWINESTKTAGRFQDDTLSHSQSRHWNVLISPFTSYFPPFLRPLGSGAKLSFYIKYDHVVSVSMETRITGWGLLCNSDGAKWRHSWGYLMIPSFYENTHTHAVRFLRVAQRLAVIALICRPTDVMSILQLLSFFPPRIPSLICSFSFVALSFLILLSFFFYISHSFPPQTFFICFFLTTHIYSSVSEVAFTNSPLIRVCPALILLLSSPRLLVSNDLPFLSLSTDFFFLSATHSDSALVFHLD